MSNMSFINGHHSGFIVIEPDHTFIEKNNIHDPYGFIVYGYLRNIELVIKLHLNIPMEVQDIVLMFYPKLEPFQWNKNEQENGGGYEFLSTNDATIKYTKQRYSLLKSSNIISSFIAQKIKWSIKILDMNEEKKIYLQLGFFPSNKQSLIKNMMLNLMRSGYRITIYLHLKCIPNIIIFINGAKMEMMLNLNALNMMVSLQMVMNFRWYLILGIIYVLCITMNSLLGLFIRIFRSLLFQQLFVILVLLHILR